MTQQQSAIFDRLEAELIEASYVGIMEQDVLTRAAVEKLTKALRNCVSLWMPFEQAEAKLQAEIEAAKERMGQNWMDRD